MGGRCILHPARVSPFKVRSPSWGVQVIPRDPEKYGLFCLQDHDVVVFLQPDVASYPRILGAVVIIEDLDFRSWGTFHQWPGPR